MRTITEIMESTDRETEMMEFLKKTTNSLLRHAELYVQRLCYFEQ